MNLDFMQFLNKTSCLNGIIESQKIREHERNRIAQELHDEIGQLLVCLKLELFHLKVEASHENSVPLCKRIESLETFLTEIIKKLKTFTYDLRPEFAQGIGFQSNIRSLVEELQSRTKKNIKLKIGFDDSVEVNSDIAIALYRVLQESITNSIQHSRSEKIDIELNILNMDFQLTVRDYDSSKPFLYKTKNRSLGLAGMRERIFRLGGTFSIHNDGGTIVKVTVPRSVMHQV